MDNTERKTSRDQPNPKNKYVCIIHRPHGGFGSCITLDSSLLRLYNTEKSCFNVKYDQFFHRRLVWGGVEEYYKLSREFSHYLNVSESWPALRRGNNVLWIKIRFHPRQEVLVIILMMTAMWQVRLHSRRCNHPPLIRHLTPPLILSHLSLSLSRPGCERGICYSVCGCICQWICGIRNSRGFAGLWCRLPTSVFGCIVIPVRESLVCGTDAWLKMPVCHFKLPYIT